MRELVGKWCTFVGISKLRGSSIMGKKGPMTNGKSYLVHEYDDGSLRVTCDEGHDIWIIGDLVATNKNYSANSRSSKRLLLTIPKQQRA